MQDAFHHLQESHGTRVAIVAQQQLQLLSHMTTLHGQFHWFIHSCHAGRCSQAWRHACHAEAWHGVKAELHGLCPHCAEQLHPCARTHLVHQPWHHGFQATAYNDGPPGQCAESSCSAHNDYAAAARPLFSAASKRSAAPIECAIVIHWQTPAWIECLWANPKGHLVKLLHDLPSRFIGLHHCSA